MVALPNDLDLVALKQFGQRLVQLRRIKGWSQEHLAQESGLHRTYIGAVERGEQNISLKNISKLAHALQIPISAFFPEEA
jgi:transcriptional regulator with XRE-family HTH domain